MLLVAQIFSEIGDWAARVALAVLVLDRTDSAAMTGLVVTFSVLPWIGIGQWLATLGDRLPRRQVMIICDLIRAAAFLALLIPMPIGVLLSLTFVAGLPSPPFAAARAALLPETVPGNQYPDALAVSHITSQTHAGARLPARRSPRRGDQRSGRARRQQHVVHRRRPSS